MKDWTENAKLIMAVCLMVAIAAPCGLSRYPMLVIGIWVVCGVVGFVALAYGYAGDSSPRKGRLSEEEQARDAVAGGMFMDGEDLLG